MTRDRAMLGLFCLHCGRRPRRSWNDRLCEWCWLNVPNQWNRQPHLDEACPWACLASHEE